MSDRWAGLKLVSPRGTRMQWVIGCLGFCLAKVAFSLVEVRLFGSLPLEVVRDSLALERGGWGILFLGVGFLLILLEEAFFRGSLARRIESWQGPKVAVLMTAGLFALYKGAIPKGFFGWFLAGLALSAAVRATGSLWSSVVMRAASRTAVVGLTLLLPSGYVQGLVVTNGAFILSLVGVAVGTAILVWALRRVARP